MKTEVPITRMQGPQAAWEENNVSTFLMLMLGIAKSNISLALGTRAILSKVTPKEWCRI